MNRIVPLLLVLTALSASDMAIAGRTFSQAYDVCAQNAQGATSETLACNDAEYAYQTKRMNTAYQTLLRQLSPKDQTRLRDIQRAWVLSRNGTCSFYLKMVGGGQASGIEHSTCLMNATADRATRLEYWVGLSQQ